MSMWSTSGYLLHGALFQVKRFKVSHGASPIGRSHKLPQDLATTRPCTVVCADPPLQQAAATNVPLTAYFQITRK